jgi:hypothetical protein
MLKTFSLVCLGFTLSGVLGCAADVAPTATGDHGPALAEPTAEGQSFAVQLPRDVTTENVIPAIVAAGHDEFAAACALTPGASIRILNPLASGAFEDVSCASVLQGEGTAEASAALSSEPAGERVGEDRQSLTPIGAVLCSLASLIATTAAANECKKWRGPNSEFCSVGNFGSGLAWIGACYLML